MKAYCFAALVGLGLASAPLIAQDAGDGKVDAEEALACSALFAYFSEQDEGQFDYDALVDMAARWLIVASDRAGSQVDLLETELQAALDELITGLEAQSDDEARWALLLRNSEECDANYQLIAAEFDNLGS